MGHNYQYKEDKYQIIQFLRSTHTLKLLE